MATSAALVAARETPRIHIIKIEEELTRSAFSLLDAYAQRQITLGELIKRRREELGLTHVQVMDRSGYFLYRSHELAALENGELRSVHDIWFTILCDPLKLDYNQFYGAHEKKRPQEQVVMTPMLLVIDDEVEDVQDIPLPDIPKRRSRRSRRSSLGDGWLTRQTMAQMVGLSVLKAEALAEQVIAGNAELSRWQQVVPMGKTQQQTLYHRTLVKHMLLHLRRLTSRADWISLPQLARTLKAKPEEVEQVIQELVRQERLSESCRWQTLSPRGLEQVYYHPGLPQAIRAPLTEHLKKHRWQSRSSLALEVGSSPVELDELALILIRAGTAREQHRRVVGCRKNTEKVLYHPELAHLLKDRFDAARQQRRAKAEEAKRQRIEARQKKQAQAKLAYNNWSFKAQVAKQAKVAAAQVDHIAQQVIADGLCSKSWRVVGGGKKQPRIRYHPELVKLVVAQAESERNAQAEARQQRLAERRKEAERTKDETQRQRAQEQAGRKEIRRRRKDWLDRIQVAKQLGVSVEAITQAADQLLCAGRPSAALPFVELLFAPEMVEQIEQVLRDSNCVA